jgi:O-antigen/teichoic acid export membrane protein
MDVVKQIFALTPFTFLNHFSRIVLTIVLARLMSPEHYGSFAALLVLSEVLLLPASLGFSSSLMRLAMPLYKTQQMDFLRGLQQVYLLSISFFGVIFVAFVLLGFSIFSPHQLANEHLVYLLLIVPLGALMITQSAFLLVLNKKTMSIISRQSLFQILTLIFCVAIYLFSESLPLATICQTLILSIALVVIYQYWLINSVIKRKCEALNTNPLNTSPLNTNPLRTKAFNTKSWYQQSLVLLASGAGTVLVAKLDVLLVHHLLGAHAVSVFFPAVVITGLLMILSDAVMTYLKPLLLTSPTEKYQSAKNELLNTMRVFWCANTLIILALMLAAKPLLRLYGETQLMLGYEVLLVMLAAQLLLPLKVISSSLIKFTGNPLHNLYVLLSVTTLTVLLALYLHHDYQLLGVAIAFACGFVLGTILRACIVVLTLKKPIASLLGFNYSVLAP